MGEKNNGDLEKKNKVVKLEVLSSKDKEKKSKKNMGNVFVTDDRFRYAMELVRADMNKALTLGHNANNSSYFLLKFLAEKRIIDLKEFESFVTKEMEHLSKEKPDKP